MKVLITGGSGFLGTALSVQLGSKFKLLSLQGRKAADLTSYSELEKVFSTFQPELVIHAASETLAKRGPFNSEASHLFRNNTVGTLNLLDLASRTGVRRFIFISSNSVFGAGYQVNSGIFPRPQPSNWYSQSKWISEQALETYNSLMQTISIRFPTILGPTKTESDLPTEMIQSVLEKRPIEVFGDGKARRQFVHLSDACAIIESCISKQFPTNGVILPVTPPEAHSILELGREVIDTLGSGQIELNSEALGSPDQWIDPSIFSGLLQYSFQHSLKTSLKDIAKEIAKNLTARKLRTVL